MNRQLSWILATLFILGALLIWRPFSDDEIVATDPQFREIPPDFIAEGLATRVYNSDGQLEHRINATKMTHYSPIGLTELDRPVYQVRPDGKQETWQVIAEQGSFYDDKTLVLERNIVVTHLAADDFLERVETSYLTIDTLAETMITDQPVAIFGKNFLVRGNGMIADLRAETLELNEHVQTTYSRHR
ncbi:Lipopolysaccharide export system protein LptC [Pseudidiomarina piscicola]|uniref:Lipopolysaccharide export system protein LptC n=1 Tax=Pseudidiomarina piscicola TaxID=2614830 RepID=A0A6S6WU21_9GAMM|nr:LPS export ABC transporter periplasmic protein LptC [Pseudidiomarina piscicola]CAB0150541.1 Lipopolysaccharide export system protein LptC [Pseudidiomarina piscicola]VZT40036.1 Lipopolysaccharide export system protein LptC [Pseudomonas aeruginosa]